MSFSNEVKDEMLSIQLKKNCCKKAYMLGLLYNAEATRSGECNAVFNLEQSAMAAAEALGAVAEPIIEKSTKAGRSFYNLSFLSKSATSFLYRVENNQSIASAAAFRCDVCRTAFMRGILISSATVNDPHKGYHLEISLSKSNEKRLEPLRQFMSDCGFDPKMMSREKKVSLYFKSNTQISDLISYAGAMRSSFEFANVCIERDIRNNENRATNCVAKNISKSVKATRKQIDAINKLIACHKFESLSPELEMTARLRIENEMISLSDLAKLHEPPISKSGLNHRLEKICELADECDSGSD